MNPDMDRLWARPADYEEAWQLYREYMRQRYAKGPRLVTPAQARELEAWPVLGED